MGIRYNIKKLEKSDSNEFVKRFFEGDTLQEIADDYGVTRQRVHQLIHKKLYS